MTLHHVGFTRVVKVFGKGRHRLPALMRCIVMSVDGTVNRSTSTKLTRGSHTASETIPFVLQVVQALQVLPGIGFL